MNITLKNGGVCDKYLFEMNHEEVIAYTKLLEELFDVKNKFTS